jgi:DNA processing protein
MFSIDELGLIAHLNDNARSATNRSMTEMKPDIVARALDRYLSKSNADGPDGEGRLVDLLNERKVGREALFRTTARIREYLDRGIRVITYWDAGYPGNLRLAPDPPLILYVDGRAFPGSDHVAIIGTSHPSEAGLDLAYEYGARISKKGRTVVSGLTNGIDAQALEGALSASGSPIAVLGTPLTDIYPDESRALAAEVAEGGAIVSELTEEAYLHPGRFLQRNRMINGMAGSVVVIESTGVGALYHLVDLTLRQGRRAYIVDRSKFEDPEHEAGFRRLRDLGAVPIAHVDDMLSQEARQNRLC